MAVRAVTDIVLYDFIRADNVVENIFKERRYLVEEELPVAVTTPLLCHFKQFDRGAGVVHLAISIRAESLRNDLIAFLELEESANTAGT